MDLFVVSDGASSVDGLTSTAPVSSCTSRQALVPVVELGFQPPRSLLESLCTLVGFTRELGARDVISLGVAPPQCVGGHVGVVFCQMPHTLN